MTVAAARPPRGAVIYDAVQTYTVFLLASPGVSVLSRSPPSPPCAAELKKKKNS